MAFQASGTFEVKLTPQPPVIGVGDPSLGRMALDKQFRGDLEATSLGQMLAANTATAGSAGYVALERVVGTLHGRAGSFTLQHSGTLNRGLPSLSVTVVPDSGDGELAGLAGSMTLELVGGKHSYRFDYVLAAPDAPAAGPDDDAGDRA